PHVPPGAPAASFQPASTIRDARLTIAFPAWPSGGSCGFHPWVRDMKKPIRVAVTGAAGPIGYALLFRIASGQMFGPEQPIILQLIEAPIEKAMQGLAGVAMELDDCAFPLLQGTVQTSNPEEG